jgi:hypothetical protein
MLDKILHFFLISAGVCLQNEVSSRLHHFLPVTHRAYRRRVYTSVDCQGRAGRAISMECFGEEVAVLSEEEPLHKFMPRLQPFTSDRHIGYTSAGRQRNKERCQGAVSVSALLSLCYLVTVHAHPMWMQNTRKRDWNAYANLGKDAVHTINRLNGSGNFGVCKSVFDLLASKHTFPLT